MGHKATRVLTFLSYVFRGRNRSVQNIQELVLFSSHLSLPNNKKIGAPSMRYSYVILGNL